MPDSGVIVGKDLWWDDDWVACLGRGAERARDLGTLGLRDLGTKGLRDCAVVRGVVLWRGVCGFYLCCGERERWGCGKGVAPMALENFQD